MKEFTNIFMTQIQMLAKKSKNLEEKGEGLELTDLRKLETLAKAWRTYQGSEIDSADETLKDLTSEQLKEYLTRLDNVPEIQSEEKLES